MSNEDALCKSREFLLSADWDGALAALHKKDGMAAEKDGMTAEDYANRAYARCFQAGKAQKDGNYDDAVADASNALAEDCQNKRALCIRAYAYYLNENYEKAITDCESVKTNALDKAALKKDAKTAADEAEKAVKETKEKAAAAEKANAPDDTLKKDVKTAAEKAEEAVKKAKEAQEAYCNALRPDAFVHELLGMIYTNMGNHHEASRQYKLALHACQTDIESLSPLLMDAYRNACAAVKGY